MNPNDVLGEVLEKGQKTAVSAASDVSGSVQSQIGIANESATNLPQTDRTKEMVKDFYSPSDDTSQNPTTEEQEKYQTDQKLAKVRQKLHQEQHNEVYFNQLQNAGAPKQHEETTVEKLEKEEKNERWELQQKEAEKPPPLAAQRAAQRVERFPGASG